MNEEWFSDMYGVREKVGLIDEQPGPSASGKVLAFAKCIANLSGNQRV